MSALGERRQRAREAAHDRMCIHLQDGSSGCVTGVEQAIETATRVRITDEIEDAAEGQGGFTIHDYAADDMRRVLIAAFQAAGFEVEQ